MFSLTITNIVVAVTVIVSLLAFQNRDIMNQLIFHPFTIKREKQYYRFLTSGFIHADIGHLFFNMFALYFFGSVIDAELWAFIGRWFFLLLYITGIIISSIPTYRKNVNNSYYLSLGASGGVSSVIFATILISPKSPIYLYFFRDMDAYLFGILYLAGSYYLTKRPEYGGNINHSAHLWGAIWGLILPIAFKPAIFNHFINVMFGG